MSKIVPGQSVNRAASAIAGASGSGAKKRYWYPVEIPEDVWLDALKYLNCLKWSKMRLVSRHLNGMVQRNVSRLPLAIIESAEIRLKERKMTEVKLIVSNSAILPNEKDQWFKDQGMTIDLPASIQLNNPILGVEFKKNRCADLCILGTEQEKKLTPYEKTRPWFAGEKFKSEVFFYAEFSPHRNKYSWASITFFLKLLYDPLTYVKELSMYALDKKLKEILFAEEEERYIRCESFRLEITRDASVDDICKSVSWVEKNVQADVVQFPDRILYDDRDICDAMSNYLLGSSWISASQVVKLGRVNDLGRVGDLERFLKALIQKFRIIGTVQSFFPTILFSGVRLVHGYLRDDPLEKLLSEKGIMKEKREHSEEHRENTRKRKHSEEDIDETYTISNGPNRMRIKFVREPEKTLNFGMRVHIYRIYYGYDIRVTFEANE